MKKENLRIGYGCILSVIFLVFYIQVFPKNDIFEIIIWCLLLPVILSLVVGAGFIMASIHNYVLSSSTNENNYKVYNSPNNVVSNYDIKITSSTKPSYEPIKEVMEPIICRCKLCGVDLNNIDSSKKFLGYCCREHYDEAEKGDDSLNKKCEWCGTYFNSSKGSSIDSNFCCDQHYCDWQCCYDSDD